jgi:glutathione synthase/RimK-type ligase-like ATP-grasp enzyme
VAKQIESGGYQVSLKTPEQLMETDEPHPSLVFLMCERMEALGFLEPMEARGIPHVNPLRGVLNTYRDRMIPLLSASAVPIPTSQIIPSRPSDHAHHAAGRLTGLFPVWVKRADVHYTQSGDVECVRSPAELEEALSALHGRGLPRVVLQQHIPGDLIKFYGVGAAHAGGPEALWFRWFYHRDQELAGHPFSEETLQRIAQMAGSALGLEVYGGDAIVTPAGEIFLIDINAWPSFALYREEASLQIARLLLGRLSRVGSR